MKFALVNESTLSSDLTPTILRRIADAITRQLDACYAPVWEATGGDVVVAAKLEDVPGDTVPVVILDDADQADALGYHATGPGNRPYARVFLGPILANGGTLTTGELSLSAVLSHEILETAGDPYAGWWSDAPDGNEYAIELCDPVEGDSYEIDGVAVSNFVGPRYFSESEGPYDYMGKLERPLTMTAGGYLIFRTASGDVQQVFGEAYPTWKREKHTWSRAGRRGRRARKAA